MVLLPTFGPQGEILLIEQRKTHKYGNTQVNISPTSAAAVALDTVRSTILETDLAGQGRDVEGNHITVRYGIIGDSTGIAAFLATQKPFEVTLESTAAFTPTDHSDGAAVIIAPVISEDLKRINKQLAEHGDFKKADFDYTPHATVAYVKSESVNKYVGCATTRGITFEVTVITISSSDGTETDVALCGREDRSLRYSPDQPRDADGKFGAGDDVWNAAAANPTAATADDRKELEEWSYKESENEDIAARQEAATDVAANIALSTEQVLVVKYNDKVLGGIAVEKNVKIGSNKYDVVRDLAVHPDVIGGTIRAVGIGTVLIETAAKNASRFDRGIYLQSLDSESSKFYEHIGMTRVSSPGHSTDFSWSADQTKAVAAYGVNGYRIQYRFNPDQPRDKDGKFSMGNVASFKNEKDGIEAHVTSYNGKFHVNLLDSDSGNALPSSIFSGEGAREKAIEKAQKLAGVKTRHTSVL